MIDSMPGNIREKLEAIRASVYELNILADQINGSMDAYESYLRDGLHLGLEVRMQLSTGNVFCYGRYSGVWRFFSWFEDAGRIKVWGQMPREERLEVATRLPEFMDLVQAEVERALSNIRRIGVSADASRGR